MQRTLPIAQHRRQRPGQLFRVCYRGRDSLTGAGEDVTVELPAKHEAGREGAVAYAEALYRLAAKQRRAGAQVAPLIAAALAQLEYVEGVRESLSALAGCVLSSSTVRTRRAGHVAPLANGAHWPGVKFFFLLFFFCASRGI